MKLLSINYFVWLIFSVLFFAIGEYLSKKFAINPKISYVLLILICSSLSALVWLPEILQKNQLSIVGTMWSVLSLLVTVLIGVIIFKENLTSLNLVGIVAAFISITLLSIS